MNGEQGFDQSLYKRFPTARARPKSEVETLKKIWCAPRGWEYITAVSNNYIPRLIDCPKMDLSGSLGAILMVA